MPDCGNRTNATGAEISFVTTFVNMGCLAEQEDACSQQVAQDFSNEIMRALRMEYMIGLFLSILLYYATVQPGGIPRPLSVHGMVSWAVWMLLQSLQYTLVVCTIGMQVASFASVRYRLRPCLIDLVEGWPFLDFFFLCTFAVQPAILSKLLLLVVYADTLSSGLCVLAGGHLFSNRRLAQAEFQEKAKGDEVYPSHHPEPIRCPCQCPCDSTMRGFPVSSPL
eukprot:284900-Prymnesium_polylepis.1